MQFTVHGTEFTIDLDNLPDEMVDGLLEQGVKILAQRVNAGNGDLSESDKANNVADLLDRLRAGTYRFGGGGGSSVSPVVKFRRDIIRDAAKAKGKTGLTVKQLDAMFANQPEAVQAKITAKAEKLAEQAATDGIEVNV